MSKKYTLGVPYLVFALIVLGILACVLDFALIVVIILVPVVGYYTWQLRAKTKELEERLAALEGRRSPPKQD